MKCGKICYPTKGAAEFAKGKIPAKKTGLLPSRTYRCGKCKAWHITSKVGRR